MKECTMNRIIKFCFSLNFIFSLNYLISMKPGQESDSETGLTPGYTYQSPAQQTPPPEMRLTTAKMLPYFCDSWISNALDIIMLLEESFTEEDEQILLNLWKNLCSLTWSSCAGEKLNAAYQDEIGKLVNGRTNNSMIIKHLQEYIGYFYTKTERNLILTIEEVIMFAKHENFEPAKIARLCAIMQPYLEALKSSELPICPMVRTLKLI